MESPKLPTRFNLENPHVRILSGNHKPLTVAGNRSTVDEVVGAVPVLQLLSPGDVIDANRFEEATGDRALAVRQNCDDGRSRRLADKALGLSSPSVGRIRRRLPE